MNAAVTIVLLVLLASVLPGTFRMHVTIADECSDEVAARMLKTVRIGVYARAVLAVAFLAALVALRLG